MLNPSESSKSIAPRSEGAARAAIARRKRTAVTSTSGARQLLDPLLAPFVVIAVWAVVAAITIGTFAEFPIGGRGTIREPPVAEEILIVAPSPEATAQPSAALRDETASSTGASR